MAKVIFGRCRARAYGKQSGEPVYICEGAPRGCDPRPRNFISALFSSRRGAAPRSIFLETFSVGNSRLTFTPRELELIYLYELVRGTVIL